LFYNDAIPCIITACFALSNGYVSTISMVYGPTFVEDFEKETAGIIMSVALNAGIITGSWSGILLGNLLNFA